MMKRLASLLLLGAFLAACATPPPPPPPPPPSGPQTYRLVTMMGRAPTFDGATLTLDGPRATGSTGCNTYMARHDPAPGAARPFTWFQLTRMACSELQMAMERTFLDTLDAARSLERAGEDLLLRDSAGVEIARLTRAPSQPAAPTS